MLPDVLRILAYRILLGNGNPDVVPLGCGPCNLRNVLSFHQGVVGLTRYRAFQHFIDDAAAHHCSAAAVL
jgi:hypothetical protein